VLLKAGVIMQLIFLPWWARYLLTIIWLIGMSNAFNLMDIMDGLATGLGAIAGIFLLAVAVLNERWVVAAFTAALVGSLIGFLRYNFPPASIYLGDCGSLFIGLSLGALAMVMSYTDNSKLGFIAPLYILALPLLDTVYVIFLRVRSGRKIYHGSPDHFPLRLRRKLGGSTTRTVLVIYATAVVLGSLGLLVMYIDPVSTLIITGVVGLFVVTVLVWLGRIPMEG
jgi:UDP-GlcNAc:undecaprenyl-phosphate GlcNAc-1-phosphate transferase